MKSSSSLAIVLIMPTLLPVCAWALEPQSVDVAGMQFIPTLKLSESYDDNFRQLNKREEASWITTIAPELTLVAEDRNSAYRLTYKGNSQIYHDASDASNTDHKVKLESIMEFTARQRLKLTGEYRQMEDTANTTVVTENDKYHVKSIAGIYSYGAEKASNRIDLGASYAELRYDNSGNINTDEERDTTSVNAVWFHRLGGSTTALIEVRHADYDYLLANSPRDNTEDALLAGAVWEATAKTTGKLRVGYERKNFRRNDVDDLESPMWEIGIDWKPRTYSKFSLSTRQSFDEGDDGSNAIKNTSSSLAWSHGWTHRITSRVFVGYSQQDYEGQDRQDDVTNAGATLTYKIRSWLDIGVGYTYIDNNSDADNEGYKRNIYMISLTGSL